MGERSFSEIVLGADARQSRSRRLYRVGEVTSVCGDLATVRVDADDAGDEVCLRDLQVLGPWAVQVGDWVELGYLDDHPNSAYVRSPLFSETRDPALGFKARLTVGDWDAVVDVKGGGDFTNIQSALDAGCKTILVRKGTYSQSGANLVVSQPDVVIVGESPAAAVIDFENTSYYLWAQNAALRFALRNIKLINSQQSAYGALRVSGQSSLIEGCRFDTNARHVYVESGADYAAIRNCIVAAGEVGAFYATCMRFTDNRAYNTALYYLRLQGTHNIVLGNILRYTRIEAAGTGHLIASNIVDAGQIYLAGVYRGHVIGNHVRLTPSGIGAAIPAAASRCIIQGNEIDDPAGHGIDIWGGGENTVAGNVCHSAGQTGIITTVHRNIIHGNQIHDAAGWGVYIGSGATNNIVSNNVVRNNAGGQINDLGTGTVLDNNVTS